jgi:hypothetical protein
VHWTWLDDFVGLAANVGDSSAGIGRLQMEKVTVCHLPIADSNHAVLDHEAD